MDFDGPFLIVLNGQTGKSICYQLPPLYTQSVALVVSPLISLMQDQVHKLNSLSDKKLATFLGSAQHDPMEETLALRGEYRLVYVTPEKLVSSGFLSRVSQLNLCLIAVDESHCVR
jgi:ATP-dependent DNA helicase RecQ